MTNKNDYDEDADKEISQLLLGVSKKGKGSGLFPGSELIQLNAEGLEGLFDDDDDQAAVQTAETDQTVEDAPAEEAPAAEATAEAPAVGAAVAEAPATEATAEAPAVAEATAEAPAAEAPATEAAPA